MNLKKPKFWDYKNPNIFAYLLYPLSLIIKSLNIIKFKHQKKIHNIKTICVGNIYLGGTGKTSLSIQIKKILTKKNISSCFVKKFYRDQTDEQIILKKNGKLFLSKSRIDAIKNAEESDYKFAILDDGLQDNSFYKDISFVCFNNINWIGNGMTIPSGPLREDLKNLKNYEHVFLNGNLENLSHLKNEILKFNSKIHIHIGKYEITNLEEFNLNNKFLVFSGIGNHKTLISMMKKYNFIIVRDIEFPDHYQYSSEDIKKLIKTSEKLDCQIITTEKDFNRIKNLQTNEIKYLKSELKVMDEDKLINSII